jgi:hypothetical protein
MDLFKIDDGFKLTLMDLGIDSGEEDYQAEFSDLLSTDIPRFYGKGLAESADFEESDDDTLMSEFNLDDEETMEPTNSQVLRQVIADEDAISAPFDPVVADPTEGTLQPGLVVVVAPTEDFVPHRPARRVMPRNSINSGTIVPQPGDVTTGGGGAVNARHTHYMNQVKIHRPQYQENRVNSRSRLREIGSMVVAGVHNIGGRFLDWNYGPSPNSIEWFEMDDEQAIDKAMASLRDEIRKYPVPRAPVLPPEFRP